jgi:hypothetical protein
MRKTVLLGRDALTVATLCGPALTTDFKQMVTGYIERRFGGVVRPYRQSRWRLLTLDRDPMKINNKHFVAR